MRREPGHTYVIPQDALRMVDDGVLDRRLFDVAQLVRDGYDDARRTTLPLIVGYRKDAVRLGAFATTRDALAGVARERRPLPAVDGEAFDAPKAEAAALWSAVTGSTVARTAQAAPQVQITRVWLDGKVRTTLDASVPQIGAPVMWQAGWTGKGVKDAELTVPAGGSATTTVTVDSRKGTADGTFGGSVLAAGGGQSVRTGLVVVREVESYDVTLRHKDVDGADAPDYATAITLTGPEPGRIDVPRDPDGTVVQRLPKGEYQLQSAVFSADGGTAVFVQPVLKVTARTTVTLDARKAKPFAVTAPNPAARLVSATVGYDDQAARVGSSWAVDGQTPLRTAALGPAGADLRAQYNGLWKVPGAGGEDVDYRLAFHRTGSWFTGLTRTVTRAEVAEVKLGFGASVTGARSQIWAVPLDESGFGIGVRDPIEQSLPLARTLYVSAGGVRWNWDASQLDAQGEVRISYSMQPVAFKAGVRHVLNFNTGVVGPDLGASAEAGATRYGDHIDANLQLFNDGSGHSGYSYVTGGFTRLESGGKVIAEGSESGWVSAEVPAGSAAYRLSAESSRSAEDTTTSTKVAAVWTFTSARPPGHEQVRLPLSTVRLAPKLSLSGTAPAGASLKVPLHLGGKAAETGRVASLTVKVSYDGGRTWKPLTVTADAKGARSVNVNHPAKAEAVSFQVDLKDTGGNTVRETITNAYRLAP
ncbi:hypothetical protein Sxan_01610 [Streptomyces xanthophaeus]|uniref:Uncharacterized protein n=1 Tax=Streptomyces xanthophaeus TaxID=67385 RepID=A0A919GRW4_9ACTN|nr:hypothetical protein Sxan_01610 [Streptomyces xanthophaeus]